MQQPPQQEQAERQEQAGAGRAAGAAGVGVRAELVLFQSSALVEPAGSPRELAVGGAVGLRFETGFE